MDLAHTNASVLPKDVCFGFDQVSPQYPPDFSLKNDVTVLALHCYADKGRFLCQVYVRCGKHSTV